MPFELSPRSERNLFGVHPDLVRVVRRAIQVTKVDFCVVEGKRTIERQRELVTAGKSHTMKSRHLNGFAVDLVAIVDGHAKWDMQHAGIIADAMGAAARELSVSIEWGGNWPGFRDGPHFQLIARKYPDPT